jgi:hypothetical protein
MARNALQCENVDIFPHFSEEGMAQGMEARICVEIAFAFHVSRLTSQCLNAKRPTRISQGSEYKLASGFVSKAVNTSLIAVLMCSVLYGHRASTPSSH